MEIFKTSWEFFQNEILGLRWLNRLIGSILNAWGLDTSGRIGGSIQFFLYDTVKIMFLLGVLILMISYIQSYFPPERTKKILGRFHGIWANFFTCFRNTMNVNRTVLLLLVNSPVHRLYKRRFAPWRDFFVSDFLSDG